MADLQDYIPGRVIQRTEYGAPATPGGRRRDRSNVVGYALHWTDTPTNATPRAIRGHHVNTNGWLDIGYGYLVDIRYGDVIVGRGRYRSLAHAPGANTTWLGVASIAGPGDPMTDEEKAAHIGLRRWLRDEGGMVNMSQVGGHRDLSATACPGDERAAWVDAGMPGPRIEPEPDEMRYSMVIYTRRDTPDSLSAYTILSQHNAHAVFTHSRGEAWEALDRGETVVAVGGPACGDLDGRDGDKVLLSGRDRYDTLREFGEWAQDNL